MKTPKLNINLLLLTQNDSRPEWGFGSAHACLPNPKAINECLNYLLNKEPGDAWLFWDPTLGQLPSSEDLRALLDGSVDAWHAGLILGLAGQPDWIDFVAPTWMLNRDPDAGIQASSWRLSLRACLIRTEVLHQLGGPDPHYQSLAAAGLELGFRFIRQGAFVQHDPGLVSKRAIMAPSTISLVDQCRFIQAGFGRRWALWSGFRAVASGAHSPSAVINALRQADHKPPPIQPAPYQRPTTQSPPPNPGAGVTVLIPTINRYPYLRTLLGQLRHQTMPPLEVIVVDQTPHAQRDLTLKDEFSDLPLRWFMLDRAGQCSSRNLGLQKAQGDFILFIDDDDEIPPDLIEKHIAHLAKLGINISNGVAHEVGAGEPPPDFQYQRVSNVFPTNNTMIHKAILHKSGLFDLAYDHGQRADHDLGMRLYLGGELLVLNPEIAVLHHHAPIGGLREHKARVSTYAASRQRLLKRNLPTVSDIYQAKRYFTDKQVNEMIWISILGTFSLRGTVTRRIIKVVIGLLGLPTNVYTILNRWARATAMFNKFPQTPDYMIIKK